MEKNFPKCSFDSFVGVSHLTHGGRSCSWALYRFAVEVYVDTLRKRWAEYDEMCGEMCGEMC